MDFLTDKELEEFFDDPSYSPEAWAAMVKEGIRTKGYSLVEHKRIIQILVWIIEKQAALAALPFEATKYPYATLVTQEQMESFFGDEPDQWIPEEWVRAIKKGIQIDRWDRLSLRRILQLAFFLLEQKLELNEVKELTVTGSRKIRL